MGRSVSVMEENPDICNQSNGSATVEVSGGQMPYDYDWQDPIADGSPSVTGLAAGSYTVTVTDYNGCTATAVVTIGTSGWPNGNGG